MVCILTVCPSLLGVCVPACLLPALPIDGRVVQYQPVQQARHLQSLTLRERGLIISGFTLRLALFFWLGVAWAKEKTKGGLDI